MKPWLRGVVALLLGVGVGAIIAAILGLTAAASPRIGWVFAAGAVIVVVCAAAGFRVGMGAMSAPTPLATVPKTAPHNATPAHAAPPRRGVIVALGVAGVLVGFASSTVIVLGGIDRTVAVVAELPGRISGEVHGTWDSRLLEQDLADLQASLGDRPLQNLYFFDTYFTVDAYSVTGEQGVDGYVFRNGDLSLSSQQSGWDTSASFTIADVNPNAMRRIAETIYADDPDTDISLMYISSQYGLRVVVGTEGTYDTANRVFDAVTGEEITER